MVDDALKETIVKPRAEAKSTPGTRLELARSVNRAIGGRWNRSQSELEADDRPSMVARDRAEAERFSSPSTVRHDAPGSSIADCIIEIGIARHGGIGTLFDHLVPRSAIGNARKLTSVVARAIAASAR